MNTRLSINLESGQLDVEGAPEFVERIYSDFRDLFAERASKYSATELLSGPEEQIEGDREPVKAKSVRRRSKGGPSCASRIQAIKDEGYFAQLRSAGDVGQKLREKGTAYEGKHIAASLVDLVKRGVLRRVNDAGAWFYQNP